MSEALTGLKRSCMCANVSEAMIGQEVTVMGWVQRRRDLGQLIFIALRDKTGLVQIAIDENTAEKELFAKAETVRSEYVLAVRGLVAARTEGNINPNMKTGKIEIIAKELRILSDSETTPFQIEDNITVKDDLRLKYRYLDLRRPSQLNNLVLRQELQTTLTRSRQWLEVVNLALSRLSRQDRQLLDRLYISPEYGGVEQLCRELEIEKSTLYRRRDQALLNFTRLLYGSGADEEV